MDHIAEHIFRNDLASKIPGVKPLEQMINLGLIKFDKDAATKFALGIKSTKYFELDQTYKIVFKPKQAIILLKYCHATIKNENKPYEKRSKLLWDLVGRLSI